MNKYQLEFLKCAKEDLDEIIFYICYALQNHTAALNLIDSFQKAFEYILLFPYGSSKYYYHKRLKYAYRVQRVKKYLIFYRIEEKKRLSSRESYIIREILKIY